MKLWKGRFSAETDSRVHDFNSSLRFDARLYKEDIEGSIAHAAMLGACGIVSPEDAQKIRDGLLSILADLEAGAIAFDPAAEDIHTFVEALLTERIGPAGGRLHTARSRNDQVALDFRLYVMRAIAPLIGQICALVHALTDIARANTDTVMPGYTHLQRAQPVTLAHVLCAYAEMFTRDVTRLEDARRRMDACPLGSGALAGTGYPIDRFLTARSLGFSAVTANTLDGVSDRDFALEFTGALAILMMHMSRLSEEIILWCSSEFGFAELDDAFSTGSSIMPQKKNPDVAELARGKTGRVYGDLFTLLTVMKSLPLAYNKDMQEDKEPVFDALDTVSAVLDVFPPMLRTLRFKPERMQNAVSVGFLNATDCADFLVGKGLPFREAYAVTGGLVALCVSRGISLEQLPLSDFQAASPLFDEEVYAALAPLICVKKRKTPGGPAPEAVRAHLEALEGFLGERE